MTNLGHQKPEPVPDNFSCGYAGTRFQESGNEGEEKDVVTEHENQTHCPGNHYRTYSDYYPLRLPRFQMPLRAEQRVETDTLNCIYYTAALSKKKSLWSFLLPLVCSGPVIVHTAQVLYAVLVFAKCLMVTGSCVKLLCIFGRYVCIAWIWVDLFTELSGMLCFFVRFSDNNVCIWGVPCIDQSTKIHPGNFGRESISRFLDIMWVFLTTFLWACCAGR